jgi:hypothetical protein
MLPAVHWPEPLHVRALVSTDPLHIAAAHIVPLAAWTHVPVVAEHAPVFPHMVLLVSFGHAVAQQIPADPVELALTQLPLEQSAPLFALLAVLHACPLAACFTHCPPTHA